MKKQRYNNFIPLMVLMLALVFLITPNGNAAVQFTDIKGHWAEAAIQKMADKGVATGFPDGSFRPDINITRAEFCTLVVKAFKLESTGGKVFNDTSQHWAKEYVTIANAGGIVSGYEDGSFRPDNNITRQEMALMIVKAAQVQIKPGILKNTDSGRVSTWAKDAVATAYDNNIITGMPDGSFLPLNNATRAEATIVLDRGLEIRLSADPSTDPVPPISDDQATISGIAVKNLPGNTYYLEGEKLNLSGLVVTLTKSDGQTEDVSPTDFANRGITASPANGTELAKDTTAVTLTAYGKTTSFRIHVTPAGAGGGGGGGGGTPAVAVTGVTLDKNALELIAGEDCVTLAATIAPAKATNKKVTWSSSNENVATVVNGVVTPVAAGSATITVTTADGGYTADCLVTVGPAGEKLSISPTSHDFDKYAAEDFDIDITWGPATEITEITGEAMGGALAIKFIEGIHYIVDGNILTIKKDWTELLPVLVHFFPDDTIITLTIAFDQGVKTFDIKIIGGEIVVTGLSIKDRPTKVNYNEGEQLDLAGLVVTLTKSDSSTEDIPLTDFAANGISTEPADGDVLDPSHTEVVITVNDKTTTQPITVNAVTITGVSIKTPPAKVNYTEGETLDLTGLVVTLDKSDGSFEEVVPADFAAKGISVSPTSGAVLDTSDTTVTITANGITAEQTIAVVPGVPVTVTGITVKTTPANTIYNEGEQLDLAGLVVTLTKSDGSTEDVSLADFAAKGITTVPAAGDLLGIDDTEVIITANGKTAAQPITVNEVSITGISIKSPPEKTEYNDGEKLDLTGLVVTLTKSDGSTEDISPADFAARGILTEPADGEVLDPSDTEVIISVEGETVIQAITIIAADEVTVENVTAEERTGLAVWYRFDVSGDYDEILIQTEDGTDLGPVMAKAAFEAEGHYQGGVSPDGIIVIYIDGVEKYRGTPDEYTGPVVTVENVTAENRTTLVTWYRFDVSGDYDEILIQTEDGTDLGPVMAKAEFEAEGYYQGGVSPDGIIVIYIDGVEKYRGTPDEYTGPIVTVENVTAESRTNLVTWYRFDVSGDYDEILIQTEDGTDLGPVMAKDAFEAEGYYQGGVSPDGIIVIYIDGVEKYRGTPDEYTGPVVTVENVTAEERTGLAVWYRFDVIGDYATVQIKAADGTELGPVMTKAAFEAAGHYQGGVSPDGIIVIYVDGVEKYRGTPDEYTGPIVTVENVTAESRTNLVTWYRFDVIGDYDEILIKTEDGTDLGPVMAKDAFEAEGYYQGGVSPDGIIVIYIDGVEKYRGTPDEYTGPIVTVKNVTAESRTDLVTWYRFDVSGDYDQILIQTEDGTDLGPIMARAAFEAEGYYQGGVSPNGIIVIYIDGVEKYRGTPDEYIGPIVTVKNVTAESRTDLVTWYRFDVSGDYDEILIQTEDGTDLGPIMARAAFEAEGYYQGGVSPNGIIVIYIDGVEKYRGTPDEFTGSVVTVENVTAEERTALVNWYRFDIIGDYAEVQIKTEGGNDLGPVMTKAAFEAAGHYQGGASPDGIIVIYIDGVERWRGTPDEFTGSVVTVENVTAEERTALVNWYRFDIIGDYAAVQIKTEGGNDLGPVMTKAAFEAAGHYQGGASPDGIIVIYIDGVERWRGTPDEFTGSVVTVKNVTAEERTALVNWYRFDVNGSYAAVQIKTEDGTDLGPVMTKAAFEAAEHYQGGVSPNDVIVIYIDGVERWRGTPDEFTGSVVTVENVTAENRTALVNWYRFDVNGSYAAVQIKTEDGTDLGPVMTKAAFDADGYYQGGASPDGIIVIYIDGVERWRGTPDEYTGPVVSITNITIKTPPAKITYDEGDALDLTGLVVTLTKSDASTEDVALADFAAHGITTNPNNGAVLDISNNSVVITAGGKTVSQAITVNAVVVTITDITIKTPPAKVTYYDGDVLDLTGLVVTLTKSNATTEDVAFADFAAKGITASPVNGAALATSNTAVTITVNGKTATQPITVNAITVTGVSVKTPPAKVTYYDGDVLDLTGLVVTLTKSNATTEDVAFADFAAKGITASPVNGAALATSNTAVTITVNGKTATQPITVNAITVTGVSVKTPPAKVTYYDGEVLDLTGLVVTLTKSNATTEDVAFADFTAKGITASPVNGAALATSNTAVTITVNGKTATQPITVNAITVTGVSVKTPPAKVTYYDGDVLDLTGLVVTLTKSNATTEDVAFADFAAKGITASPVNGAALATTTTGVVIAVNGKTTLQTITVLPVTVANVRADRSNAIYNYFYFDVYGDYDEVYITDSSGTKYGGTLTKAEFEAQGYIRTAKMINTTIRIYVDGVKKFDGVPAAI